MTKNKSLIEGAHDFYAQNVKSRIESVSGCGSFLKNTKEIRGFISSVIIKYSIKSIADCPCGDWNWMQYVDLTDINYTGLDVVQPLVQANNTLYGKSNINFRHFNILTEIPPRADLLICRDLLFHLNLADQKIAAENLKKSGSRLIMTTTFPWITENAELQPRELMAGWGYRHINAELEPLAFKNPVDEVTENSACFKRKVRVYENSR